LTFLLNYDTIIFILKYEFFSRFQIWILFSFREGVIGVVAVVSTLGASTLNIIDIWCDMSGNSTFKAWQKGLNIVSIASNSLYSIGNIYNSIKGVSGKEFIARHKAIENGKLGYGNLSDQHPRVKVGEGKEYSSSQKNAIYKENASRNGGVIRDDVSGKQLVRQTGTGPKPLNGAEVDHIIPKTKGGFNSFDNARITNWQTNLAKSNNLNFPLDLSVGGLKDIGSIRNAFGFGTVELLRDLNIFRIGVKK